MDLIKKRGSTISYLLETHFKYKDIGKDTHTNTNQNKAGVAILTSEKKISRQEILSKI